MTDATAHGLLVRWRLVVDALADQRLAKGDCAALAAILTRCNDQGEAWPSLGTVAKDAGVSRPTAVRSIRRLVDLGYLVRQSGTRTTSNRYRIGASPRCVDEPTGRCGDEPRVGAPVNLGVGAGMNLELVQLNQSIEPEQKEAPPAPEKATKPKKPKPRTQTFQEWADSLSEEQSQAEGQKITSYLAKIGAPEHFADLFIEWTSIKFADDTEKRQASWPKALANYLRNGWHGLWKIGREGDFYLTDAGENLRREMAADEGRPIDNRQHRELL